MEVLDRVPDPNDIGAPYSDLKIEECYKLRFTLLIISKNSIVQRHARKNYPCDRFLNRVMKKVKAMVTRFFAEV